MQDQRKMFAKQEQEQEQQKQQALSKERYVAMVQDAYQLQKLIGAGKMDAAVKLLDNRINSINELGGDPSDSIRVKDLLVSGDPAKFAQLQKGLQDSVDAGAIFWQPPEAEKMNPYQEAQIGLKEKELDWKMKNPAAAAASSQQFGAQETLKDSEGNLFFATSRRDPNTGQMVGVVAAVDGSNTKPVGKLSVTGGYGLTANEKVGQGAAETVAKKDAEDIVKYKSTLFDSINSNSRMLSKYNFAIKQLDNGAETGPVIRALPNLREQSVLVDVVRKEIGMEILGSGLLGVNPTDRDVDFALTTAIPDNLRPDALKRELERRGSILQDLNAAQEEYYRLIEDEGMTKGDILKLAKQKRESAKSSPSGATPGIAPSSVTSKYQIEVMP
jgi:hypothetical protein